jgi:hypothetical protein
MGVRSTTDSLDNSEFPGVMWGVNEGMRGRRLKLYTTAPSLDLDPAGATIAGIRG